MEESQNSHSTVKSQFTLKQVQNKFIVDLEYNLNDKNPELRINRSQIVQIAIELLRLAMDGSPLEKVVTSDELFNKLSKKITKRSRVP